MLLGGMLGVILGVLGAFLLEYSSNKVKSVDQIDKMSRDANLPPSVIGVVFQWNSKQVPDDSVVVQAQPESVYSEMFRQVRTGFQFALAARPGKAFIVTSVGPREGKSTIIANLGTALAQGGNRVILVDSDLRRPTLHRFLKLDHRQGGLSSVMIDTMSPVSQLVETGVPGMRALLSGPIPTNPADLLGSARMDAIIEELKADCDILLMDSPPIMAAADASILASKSDGVVMVINMGETRTDTFRDALYQIQRSGTPVQGYVVNKVKTQGLGYGRRYRYRYHYYYYYRSQEDSDSENGTTNGSEPAGGRRDRVASAVRRQVRQVLERAGRLKR